MVKVLLYCGKHCLASPEAPQWPYSLISVRGLHHGAVTEVLWTKSENFTAPLTNHRFSDGGFHCPTCSLPDQVEQLHSNEFEPQFSSDWNLGWVWWRVELRLSLATVSVMLLLCLSDPRQSNPRVTALLSAVLFTTFVLEAAAFKKQEKVNFILPPCEYLPPAPSRLVGLSCWYECPHVDCDIWQYRSQTHN